MEDDVEEMARQMGVKVFKSQGGDLRSAMEDAATLNSIARFLDAEAQRAMKLSDRDAEEVGIEAMLQHAFDIRKTSEAIQMTIDDNCLIDKVVAELTEHFEKRLEEVRCRTRHE
jgi:hypothetical protein